jgi:hypothetical protein
MNRLLDLFAGVPAWLLAHPWLIAVLVVAGGSGYLALLKIIWTIEDHREREAARRRYQ